MRIIITCKHLRMKWLPLTYVLPSTDLGADLLCAEHSIPVKMSNNVQFNALQCNEML
jgi:hypothetical protein